MDSHFINFDGRSVHDMIELLLAASGDPEAIRRLQESINAVDQRAQSSIAVVNAAVEQLEESKQDAGYYTENGGGVFGATARFQNGASIGKFVQGTTVRGIRVYGQHTEDSQGYKGESLVFNTDTKTIKQYVQNSSDDSWSEKAAWTADSDTGWQQLQDVLVPSITTGAVYARKKNGLVSIQMEHVTIASAVTSSQDLGTLPSEYRPSKTLYMPIMYVIDTATAPVLGWLVVTTGGLMRFRASANAENVHIYSHVSYLSV